MKKFDKTFAEGLRNIGFYGKIKVARRREQSMLPPFFFGAAPRTV